MSDKELNINIRTTADTSGADQTAEAINKTREAAQGAGEGAEAVNKVTDALDNVSTSAERTVESINRVKETSQEAGATLNESMGPEYEKALENANAKLDEFADNLTNADSRMKAAFRENPGLTAFIDDLSNLVLTEEEVRKKFEQLDDVFELFNNKMSNLDLGAKWGNDLDENLQKIIDGYNKEMDAADKAAEKRVQAAERAAEREAQAEARKQQASAATVERLEAGNRRASATYEELQAELESYIAKLEEARKAGDNVAQADALKNIQDLGRRIKTAGEAGELTKGQINGMAGQITIATARILGMTGSLRVAIPFIRLFGTTIKTAMGPLGWAMLLIEGLVAGVSALVGHFKAKNDELKKETEEATEKIKELAKAQKEATDAASVERIKKASDDYLNGVEKISREYKNQIDLLDEQLQVKLRLRAVDEEVYSVEDEAKRQQVETEYYNSNQTAADKSKRDKALFNIDINARRRKREVDIKNAKDIYDNSVRNQDIEQTKETIFNEDYSSLKNNGKDIINVEKYNELDAQIKKMVAERDKLRKLIESNDKPELYVQRIGKMVELESSIKKNLEIIGKNDLSLIKSGIINHGENITPKIREGAINAYEKRLSELERKVKEQKKVVDDSIKKSKKAEDELNKTERINDANAFLDQSKADNMIAKAKSEERKEQKKKEKEEERKKKEREKREIKQFKDEDKYAKELQETLLKSSVPTASSTSDLKSQTKAWAEAIKILTASLKDDGRIDDSELSAALRELAYTMKENKNQDTQTYKGLAKQVKDLTKQVNTIQRQRRNAA